jgi:YfiH family protein
MNQIHSNKVQIINDEDFNTPPKCDALITNKRNKPLMVMVADCAPILLYDPKKQVIAVAHAGRMGAFNDIVTLTINSMQENFSSKPKDILVSIGAKIGVCCYEVGEDIANEAKSLGFDYAISSVENRYYLDINTILQKQLLACGIVAEHLEIDTTCTACNTDTYYSYRAEGMTGRFAGVMMLR